MCSDTGRPRDGISWASGDLSAAGDSEVFEGNALYENVSLPAAANRRRGYFTRKLSWTVAVSLATSSLSSMTRAYSPGVKSFRGIADMMLLCRRLVG